MITVACPYLQTVRANTIYHIPGEAPQVRNTPEPCDLDADIRRGVPPGFTLMASPAGCTGLPPGRD
jgi:hypothetical protein